MSAAERVKLTTYRWQASTPNRSCTQATARNVASTSSVSADSCAAGPAPRPRCARRRAGRRAEFGQRPRVHRAVLPDLQAGQVKAERLGLPDQVLQLAERLPGRTRGGQRVLHGTQVGQESGGPGVSQVGVGHRVARSRRAAYSR